MFFCLVRSIFITICGRVDYFDLKPHGCHFWFQVWIGNFCFFNSDVGFSVDDDRADPWLMIGNRPAADNHGTPFRIVDRVVSWTIVTPHVKLFVCVLDVKRVYFDEMDILWRDQDAWTDFLFGFRSLFFACRFIVVLEKDFSLHRHQSSFSIQWKAFNSENSVNRMSVEMSRSSLRHTTSNPKLGGWGLV